jgi:predicted Zn-ribbon and HTH transcriptional regulator
MKANRSRNLFDRKSNRPFKISRYKFEAFLKCKKCFYIDRVMAVNFPSKTPHFVKPYL